MGKEHKDYPAKVKSSIENGSGRDKYAKRRRMNGFRSRSVQSNQGLIPQGTPDVVQRLQRKKIPQICTLAESLRGKTNSGKLHERRWMNAIGINAIIWQVLGSLAQFDQRQVIGPGNIPRDLVELIANFLIV